MSIVALHAADVPADIVGVDSLGRAACFADVLVGFDQQTVN